MKPNNKKNDLPISINKEAANAAHMFTLKKAKGYLEEAEKNVAMLNDPMEIATMNLKLLAALPVLRDMLLLPKSYNDIKPKDYNLFDDDELGHIDLEDLEDAQESDYMRSDIVVYEGE